MYDREIAQLQEQITSLQEQRNTLRESIEKTTDPAIRKIYQDELSAVIDDIDEIQQAIEMLRNKQEGTKNGYDKHADEVDWSNPKNWPDIRGLFGFGENDN